MRTAVAAIAAVLAGLLLGRLSAPGPDPQSPSPHTATPTPGPTSQRAGVGVGFPRTRQGAVLAAGSYQQAFADKAILRPGELRRRVEAVATPGFAPTMIRANLSGAERLGRGAFGAGVRAGVPSAFFGVPVAYRLLEFTRSRAVVQTWGFSLLGNVGAVEPTAYFGLARTELVWQRGDWRIATTRASFGPTPRLGSPRPGGEGIGLVELTGELEPYGIAP